MSLSDVLLQTLNRDDEPMVKRLKMARGAFYSPQFDIKRKESLLLKWILSIPSNMEGNNNASELLLKWLSSQEFMGLTQNDITNEDALDIIQALKSQLENNDENQAILLQSFLLLCSNNIFQQFFKFHSRIYCELMAVSFKAISSPLVYAEFIKNSTLYPRNLLTVEEFPKHFLNVVYPVLLQKLSEFQPNRNVSAESTNVVQKCLLQPQNIKNFVLLFDHTFNAEIELKSETTFPKHLLKFLIDTPSSLSFKLFFEAFCQSCKDSQYSFKCFILFAHLLQFDISNDFTINLPFKLKLSHSFNFSTSTTILLELLKTISSHNYQDTTSISKDISFSEFLKRLLKSLLALNILNSTVFEIVLKCIDFNPLVIEPISSSLVVFAMTSDCEGFEDSYEKCLLAIFNVFAKLHRVENFIAKIIPALKAAFLGTKGESICFYGFKGVKDIKEVATKQELCVEKMFTENILENLSKCLIGLASWQVINVFKTLLHHLKCSIQEYSEGKYDDDDANGLVFIELLSTLTANLLQSIKIADHTIPQNVVVKFVACLEELKLILKDFGLAILKRHHNRTAMRSFLTIAYFWAEIYVTLTYYSINNEVTVTTVKDTHYSAASLTYLHSYLSVKEWQQIIQRITNFGQVPCFRLLQKLHVQKLKAMFLLEGHVNDEAVEGVLKALPAHIRASWQDLLSDKFVLNFLLCKVDKASLTLLAEHLIEHDFKLQENHIRDSVLLTNVTTYTLMGKINKLFRVKRKRDAEGVQSFSERVFCTFPEKAFMSTHLRDIGGVLQEVKRLFEEGDDSNYVASIKSKEGKLRRYLQIMKKLPFVYSQANVQKLTLLYLMSLSRSLPDCAEDVKKELENLVIGILQACKFNLTETFDVTVVTMKYLELFRRHDLIFSLIMDNVFKNDEAVLHLESLVLHIVANLGDSRNLTYGILLLLVLNRTKKSKLSSTAKEKTAQYKEQIIGKMSKLVCKSQLLVEPYALCLKHHMTTDKNSETTQKLLSKLDKYLEYCFENIDSDNKKYCAKLFTIVLENRTQISSLSADIVFKIWSACKNSDLDEHYSHLMNLIVSSIPNEEFGVLVQDLLQLSISCTNTSNWLELSKQLKTLESILTCDVNPAKMNMWQGALESLLCEFSRLLGHCDYEPQLIKSIVHLEQSIVQAQHFVLSPPLIDMLISTPSRLLLHQKEDFESVFGFSISILEMLLKYRSALIMDRLPAFLQQYRALLKVVTNRCNSEESAVDQLDVKKAADYVHRLEKLTRNLVACKKDMSRIAVFLIADILERYEQINLYPNVKLHLNNCVYSLMSLCDHHAVSFLMRGLSKASTEMFKVMYDHYKKYYMFTGKV